MKNYIYILSIVLLGLSLTTCKNDQVTPDPSACNCQYVKEAKDYFAFKVGSWWVYEEENSLERDSVYVTQSTIDSNGYGFDIHTYSTFQNYYYHYWATFSSGSQLCSESIPVKGKCLYVKRSKYKTGDFVGEDNCFFISYKLGDFVYAYNNVYYENNKVFINQIFNLYSLNVLNFDKTIKTHELNTLIEGKQPTNHYFSKGVGLIRKELIDSNQVWNLVNYHIEP